ncbi:hypothetical protein CC1G_01135 [Coprinopsis cinerea okayama7|uniref:BRCT domain-containing protein n=1 Tax=Coprinopsis cinerea (strain Okayama-7 / 130 / ATCC MYA-4618 / FGSC 9003) TaxID=240176 RepID=A8NEM4_COPC7|nr:hypothetical protein CC1G_01135 [Coprinopsis cinerea okayama7\|eukprot:XP_001833073.1 hypothetical protein CC1G_01135 [Coprinopsis cinerea okayama7\
MPTKDPPQIFRAKDTNYPIHFYFVDQFSPAVKRKLTDDIRRHGGRVVKTAEGADYGLVRSGTDRAAKQAMFRIRDSAATRNLKVQHASMIESSIARGQLTEQQSLVKGMSGRPGGRTPFTKREDEQLARYIAYMVPNAELGGRMALGLYQDLCDAAEVDDDSKWASNHTPEAWKNRYNKNRAKMDELIEAMIPLVNPERIHHYQRSRAYSKAGGFFKDEDYEGSEDDGDDNDNDNDDEGGQGDRGGDEDGTGGFEGGQAENDGDNGFGDDQPPPEDEEGNGSRSPQTRRDDAQSGGGRKHTDSSGQRELARSNDASKKAAQSPRGIARDGPSQAGQPRSRPSDLGDGPPAKRQRVDADRSGRSIPSGKRPARSARGRPTDPEPSSSSMSGSDSEGSQVSEDDEEFEGGHDAEVTAVDFPEFLDLDADKSSAPAPVQPISHQSTLVGTTSNTSRKDEGHDVGDEDEDQDHALSIEDENPEQLQAEIIDLDDDDEFFPTDSPFNISRITRLSVASQLVTSSPVKQQPVHISPPPPAADPSPSRPRRQAARKAARAQPPSTTRVTRSRSQSVEPEHFQSLPATTKVRKGKSKASARQPSPQLEPLEEDQTEEQGEGNFDDGLPRETLRDEENVFQMITNQEDYSAPAANLYDFEGIDDQPPAKPRSLSMESDDLQMSSQLGIKASPPKPPLRSRAVSRVAHNSASKLREPGPIPIKSSRSKIRDVLAGFGPAVTANTAAVPRYSMPGKLGGLGEVASPKASSIFPLATIARKPVSRNEGFQTPRSPFRKGTLRRDSANSSEESFPLEGTKASAYKRRKTEEMKQSPYQPPAGTRASMLLSSPPDVE